MGEPTAEIRLRSHGHAPPRAPGVRAVAPLVKDAGAEDAAHPCGGVVHVQLELVEISPGELRGGQLEQACLAAEEADDLVVRQQWVPQAEDLPELNELPVRALAPARPDTRREEDGRCPAAEADPGEEHDDRALAVPRRLRRHVDWEPGHRV